MFCEGINEVFKGIGSRDEYRYILKVSDIYSTWYPTFCICAPGFFVVVESTKVKVLA